VLIHKLRGANIAIYTVPEEITKENAEEIIATQNPELNLCEGGCEAKIYNQGKKEYTKSRGRSRVTG